MELTYCSHPAGGVERPVVLDQRRLALAVVERDQPRGEIEAVIARGDQIGAGQIGISGNGGPLLGAVVAVIDAPLGHGVAAGRAGGRVDAVAGGLVDAAAGVVGGGRAGNQDVVGVTDACGFNTYSDTV